MARKNYSVDEVIKALSRKSDVRVNSTTQEVVVVKSSSKHAKCDLGNGSWGKIDYLVNHCGYRLLLTTSL